MNFNFLKKKTVEAEYINYEEGTGSYLPEDPPEAGTGGQTSEDQGVFDVNDVLTETIYKKAARWVLLVGVFLMPLFFLPWTSSFLELNKQMLLTLVAGAGLVLWLLDVVMSGKLSWRFNPLDKGIVALTGAVILSSIFSMDKFKSVFGLVGSLSDSLLIVVGFAVVYLLIVNSFDDKGERIRSYFLVSLTLALVYGLLQMFGLHIFKYLNISILQFTVSRAFNTLGSVNVLGMTAAIVLSMLYRTKISIFRYFDISKIGAFAALAVLVVINWWVLWVVAIAGMVAVVMFESLASTDSENTYGIRKFLFPMTVIVLGIFLIVVNLNLVFIKNNLPAEIAPSYGLSGKVVLETLKENPVFGYGPENFSLAFDKHGAGELRNSTLSGVKLFDSTSYVLNVAVHNGLVGLVALGFVFWLLGWLLAKNISKFRHVDMSSKDIGVVSSAVATIVAMFFYPFNLTLAFIFYLLLSFLVLAIWGNQRVVYNIEKKASLSLISSLGFIGGLILVLVGLYFVSLNYVADLKYAKAVSQTEVKDALNYTVEAINWKGNDDRFYRLSSQLALVLLSQELNTQPVKGDNEKNNRVQNYLSSAVALAQRATQVAPNESSNWTNLGQVYQNLLRLIDGADALAESAYLKASELRPGDPAFHNRIGNMYLFKAELLIQLAASNSASANQFIQQSDAALMKAEDAFKKAIELSNNFGLAIYNLGSVYERQGKLNEAIKQLETLAPFNSEQPGLAFELGILYYRANQKNKAFEQLQKAVVLFPDYANARWYLASIYEERKQIDQAIAQLERILSVEINKDSEVVVQKLKELKAGKVSIPPARVLDREPL
ncbi:MAG: hypothetical protein A2918_01985 [Candidatus Yanofskybacteria bacterium RIFCSPLOWO2_01_FULL_42_49]|uniref:Uncharacterized protein n=1 Tax=Candidatus Yanofskybacteria bacterium RIFCSPLOWO2_01_FULL_42_49 TaxID=1802694 RepID=A0A1F8GBU4_9BACT|nr:MAG: hypothetical protein A2918_01985 [Candidatus Yanofskybacteria bacterium RIFCSPLOWO2_01_FULL_42_49]